MNSSSNPKTRYLILISDCHLSAGRYFEGQLSPHEEFYYDDELASFLEYFSSGKYGEDDDGAPVEVELFINGDFLDFLNVPYQGEFEEGVTEELALYKTKAILNGHETVNAALRKFASLPGKKITYLMGNHDLDLVYESVRREIVERWDSRGQYPSENVSVLHDKNAVSYPEGVEIHHGHQFEAGNEVDLEHPLIESPAGEKLLSLPWGSIYVLKIINRMRWEREYLGKVHPIKIFLFWGLIFDTWFTLRFAFLTIFYFLKTKVFHPSRASADGKTNLQNTINILRQETKVFQTLEEDARKILDENPSVKTVIFGHTHRAMDKVYPDGKQYINSGTWTKMVDLDLRNFGSHSAKTFVHVEFKEGGSRCELREWVGVFGPHKIFNN